MLHPTSPKPMTTSTVTMMNKTYVAEIWINDGSANFTREGNNKAKLLKECVALLRQCHTPLQGYSSSVTVYKNDDLVCDYFLINDKKYCKRFYGEHP